MDRPGQLECHSKPVTVHRVVATLADVNRDYNRVELVLDGLTYEMSGPDAQALGISLNRAGGGNL